MLRRLLVVALMAVGLSAVVSVAHAIDLDETLCLSRMDGFWTDATSTCDASDTPFWVFIPEDLVVPPGVTLNVSFYDSDFAGSIQVTNHGTINADFWYSRNGLENYGVFVARRLDRDQVVNYCGSTFTVTDNSAGSQINHVCSLVTTITPDPDSGDAPLTVDWLVTVENDGDTAFESPSVALSTDGGTTTSTTLAGPPDGGDNANGVLDPGETWSWTVQTEEDADVTVTATASGTTSYGYVTTHPDDLEAQAAAGVGVATTTTTFADTTTTTATGSDATTTIPEVETDIADSEPAGFAVGVFALVGLLALGVATIRSYRSNS